MSRRAESLNVRIDSVGGVECVSPDGRSLADKRSRAGGVERRSQALICETISNFGFWFERGSQALLFGL